MAAAPTFEAHGFSEIETTPKMAKRLCLFGEAFAALSNAKVQGACEEVSFSFVSFERVAEDGLVP